MPVLRPKIRTFAFFVLYPPYSPTSVILNALRNSPNKVNTNHLLKAVILNEVKNLIYAFTRLINLAPQKTPSRFPL